MRKRLTLEDFQEAARKKGGECLSEEYQNNTDRLRFRCKAGHEWTAIAGNVRKGIWCQKCSSERQKLPLDLFRQIAEEKGGSCLSKEYGGALGRLRFRCASNHEWEAIADNVRTGSWCPKCSSERKRLTLDHFRQLATKNGGLCLSEEYGGVVGRLRFRCAANHEWDTRGSNIRRGQWCHECALKSRKLSLEPFRQIAEEKGGSCLSEEYGGAFGRLRFRCASNHEWTAIADSIRRGGWCQKCLSESKRLSLDLFRQIAIEKGGICLSEEYGGMDGRLRFRCAATHEWNTRAINIRRGQWCPECAAGRGENEAIAFVQRQTGLAFKKVRPDWLRYKKGRPLELDGYSEQEALAIEYQGLQHFEYIPTLFHETEADFNYQQEKDRWKAVQAAKRGILLLAIPASRRANPASVQAAVTHAAEESCFPIFGINSEFTGMVREMYPSSVFSELILFSAFRLFCGD